MKINTIFDTLIVRICFSVIFSAIHCIYILRWLLFIEPLLLPMSTNPHTGFDQAIYVQGIHRSICRCVISNLTDISHTSGPKRCSPKVHRHRCPWLCEIDPHTSLRPLSESPEESYPDTSTNFGPSAAARGVTRGGQPLLLGFASAQDNHGLPVRRWCGGTGIFWASFSFRLESDQRCSGADWSEEHW